MYSMIKNNNFTIVITNTLIELLPTILFVFLEVDFVALLSFTLTF